MKNSKAAVCAEGAICAALTMVILLLGTYVPFLWIVALLAGGAPLACLVCRRGFAAGAVSFVVVLLLSFMLYGNVFSALFSVILYVLPGAAAGVCVKNKARFSVSLGAVCLTVVAAMMLETFAGSALMGLESIEETLNSGAETLKNVFADVLARYGGEGVDTAEYSAQIDAAIEQAIYNIKYYLPTILISAGALIGYAVYALVSFILKRACSVQSDFIPFGSLHAPRSMVYAAIIAYFIVLLAGKEGNLAAVLSNFSTLLYLAIAVCGFSFIENRIAEKISSGPTRVVLYLAVLFVASPLIPILFYVLLTVGMFDSVFDYRHLGKGKNKDA